MSAYSHIHRTESTDHTIQATKDRDPSNRAGSRPIRRALLRGTSGYEGQPPQYVTEQLGHSAATLLRDYARVWEDFDPSQRVSAEEQIERVRSRLDGAEAAQGAERGVRRRSRSASRKGRRVPQVFHDVSNGSDAENYKTAD
jgi:hypothetical protein